MSEERGIEESDYDISSSRFWFKFENVSFNSTDGINENKHMNFGFFKGDTYTKRVDLWKAVLWHTRTLSLRKDIVDRIRMQGVKKIVFVDDLKGKRWTFPVKKVFAKMILKEEGQEAQYYFPIDIAKKEVFEVKPKEAYVLDPDQGVYVAVAPNDPRLNTAKVVQITKEVSRQVPLL